MTVLWRKGVVMQKSILAAFIALIGTTGAAAAASCSLPDVADKVDLKQVRGTNLVTVPVTINGTPRQLLLDIGTRPTKISQATVAELGLPEASRLTENIDTARVRGDLSFGSAPLQATVRQSGSGINPETFGMRVRLNSFTIGDATAKNLPFLVAKDGDMAKDAPYDGLLTNDFFKQYDVEIDFGTNQMLWLTPTTCTDPLQVAYWTNNGVAIVPMIVDGGRFKVPVTIEGHSIVAVLDTSSEHTVMRRDIAEQVMGFHADTPDMMPAGDTKDGMGQTVYRHLFPKISFIGSGTVTAGNIGVLIAANNMTGSDKEKVLGSQARSSDARIPDLVLGMDVLHHLHIYAVFGQHRLYVTQVFFS
jgi:predicted aspartyl protease